MFQRSLRLEECWPYQALLLLRELNRELLELLALDLSFHAPLVRLLQVVVDSERHNSQLHEHVYTGST